MSDYQHVTLISSDNVRFNVSRKTAERSVLIKNMLCDLFQDDESEEFEIPVPNVTGNILEKVIEWAEHHKDTIFVDDEDTRKSAPVGDWDREFLKLGGVQEILYEVILASNYLNIRPLLDACCKTVAEMIRGKSPEEIRRTFNIINDEQEKEFNEKIKSNMK